jgi:hypothetical protein
MAKIKNAADIRMGHVPGREQLTTKQPKVLRITIAADHLQSDRFTELRIEGLVYLAHSAAPKQLHYVVT